MSPLFVLALAIKGFMKANSKVLLLSLVHSRDTLRGLYSQSSRNPMKCAGLVVGKHNVW